MTEEEIRAIIRNELQNLIKNDRFVFEKLVQFLDGRNIQTGRTNGTQIATASDQKLGFFGTTPVDQPETVTNPTGGSTVDTEARTKVINVISRLKELGLIKS